MKSTHIINFTNPALAGTECTLFAYMREGAISTEPTGTAIIETITGEKLLINTTELTARDSLRLLDSEGDSEQALVMSHWDCFKPDDWKTGLLDHLEGGAINTGEPAFEKFKDELERTPPESWESASLWDRLYLLWALCNYPVYIGDGFSEVYPK